MSHLSLPASLPRFAGLLAAVALLAGLALSLQSASAQTDAITNSDVTISDRTDSGHFTINIVGTLGQLVGSGDALEVEVVSGGGMVQFRHSGLTPALGTSETAPLSEIALLRDDIDTAYSAADDAGKTIPPVDVFFVYPDAAYTTGDSPAPVQVEFRATVNLDGGGTAMSDKKTISPPETPAISVVGALRQDADGELSAGQTTQLTVGLQAAVAFGSLGEGGTLPNNGGDNAKTCVTQGAPTMVPAADADCPEVALGDDSYIQLSGPATFSDGTSQLRDGLRLKCENTAMIGRNRETGGTCYIVHDHDGDSGTDNVAPSITVASGADSDVTTFVSIALERSDPVTRFHVQLADNNADRKIYAASTGTYYNLVQSSYFGRYVIPVTAVEQIDAVTLGAAAGQSTTVGTGVDANLVLGIRNSDGQPSDVNAISSVTVTTTSGTIKVGDGTTVRGMELCPAASTCNIPISTASTTDVDLTSAATGTPSLIGAIPITLGGISKAGTATVSATVVAKAGSSQPIYRAEPITVTFSGGASSITLGGDAMPIVLNRADTTTNSIESENPGTVAANLDEASFTATATDSRNVASTLPRAVLSSVIGPDGAKVSSGITVNDGDDCGPGMKTVTNADGTTEAAAKDASKCKYTVTVTAAAASALPAGEYTLRLEATGLKTAETKFAVAGLPANVEIAPDEPGGVGETFGATITVTDADGNSVADGTAVSISVNARNSDLGASVRLVNPAPGADGKGATKTAGGAAKATFTVIGREISTINAEAGDASDIAVVNTTAVAAAAVATPSEGLSSKAANGFSTWSGIGTITASQLLADLEGITSVRLWNGKSWLPYAQVGGQDVPGALDFDINSGDNLWLGG